MWPVKPVESVTLIKDYTTVIHKKILEMDEQVVFTLCLFLNYYLKHHTPLLHLVLEFSLSVPPSLSSAFPCLDRELRLHNFKLK